MEYKVINGEVFVEDIDIFSMGGAGMFMVGDIQTISLTSAYETPPETEIVGVTFPFPLVEPIEGGLDIGEQSFIRRPAQRPCYRYHVKY